MARIATSMRGELVDFDLFEIKKAVAALPITDTVKQRERFVNKKRRRGVKRRVDEMALAKVNEEKMFNKVVDVPSLTPTPTVTAFDNMVEPTDTPLALEEKTDTMVKRRRKVK